MNLLKISINFCRTISYVMRAKNLYSGAITGKSSIYTDFSDFMN